MGPAVTEFGVDALSLLELVFEDDDAAGGLDRGALVDELPGAGGDAQLVAGVGVIVKTCGLLDLSAATSGPRQGGRRRIR